MKDTSMTHDARAALCHSVQAAMPDLHDQMDLSMSKMAKSAVMRKIGMQDQIDLDVTPVAAATVIYYALYGYLIGSQTVAEQFAEEWLEENTHEGPTYEYLKGVLDGPTLSIFQFLDRDGELGPMEAHLRDLLTGEEYLVVDELLANNSLQGRSSGNSAGTSFPFAISTSRSAA